MTKDTIKRSMASSRLRYFHRAILGVISHYREFDCTSKAVARLNVVIVEAGFDLANANLTHHEREDYEQMIALAEGVKCLL